MSKKTTGVILMVGPFCLLILTLPAYAIASFIFTTVGGENMAGVAQVIRVVLQLVGLVGGVALIPCFIIGLVMLLKK